MIPKSVRWRLPLSYAAIALLAALALGLVLLTTLRGHYRQQELDYLTDNAQAIGSAITRLFELDVPSTLLQSQLRSFAFLSQTRVRLLDTESQLMVDSGAPQDQRGVFTLARKGEMLDIQSAEELPDTPADAAGLFVRREDNRLFVGTGNLSGVLVDGEWEFHHDGPVLVDGEWEFHHDGPVIEVVTTHDTLIYRDDTLGQLEGVAPSGPIKQDLKPGSLDGLGKNSTLKAWGEKRGGRVLAELIVFSSTLDDSQVSPEDERTQVFTHKVPRVVTEQTTELDYVTPVIVFEVEPISGAGLTATGDYLPYSSFYVSSMPAVGMPYSIGLNAEAPSDGHRSDQVIRQPFYDREGGLLGYVELSAGPAYGRQILGSVARGWAVAGSVAVALAAVAGWMASRRLTIPLLALTDVTTHMAGGDLSARADVTRQDEWGVLARSFNEMAGRVEGTVDTLRRFVADAAHALHTPLTALRTNLELGADEPDSARRQEFMKRAGAQLERLETLTQSLLDLSRLESRAVQETTAPVELTALVREMSELCASRAEQAGLVFSLDLPRDSVTVQGDQGQLRRALGNLLDNALKFTPGEGEVSVGLRQDEAWVTLWVQDTGIGVPADDLPNLFNRFHRGRNAAAYPGSGLGLAIVKAVVDGHGGQVTVESSGQGARFVVRLPVTS